MCNLCDANLAPILAESKHWRLVLNRNQNLLGKCFLVVRRHLEAVPELSSAEWTDLHAQIARTTEMLTRVFTPNHFNYAFLQNQDRHVHLHVIPRYAEPRLFEQIVFEDPDYPHHYAVPAPVRRLPDNLFAELANRLGQLYSKLEISK
jgi:diadenosine tetraphosphate (Ap4A) HIT family hydrolase